jgi:hypothetical protein
VAFSFVGWFLLLLNLSATTRCMHWPLVFSDEKTINHYVSLRFSVNAEQTQRLAIFNKGQA